VDVASSTLTWIVLPSGISLHVPVPLNSSPKAGLVAVNDKVPSALKTAEVLAGIKALPTVMVVSAPQLPTTLCAGAGDSVWPGDFTGG
jgi:hypothetical protein